MILATLVYCVRGDKVGGDHVDEVLLMQRRKEPNTGLWTAPGGKLEPGESPFACARREIHEEAGIEAAEMQLRGILTLTAPRPDWDWLLFAYVVTRFEAVASADDREGLLRWWAREDIPALAMPQADRVFLAPVLDLARPVYEATFRYDADLTLAEVIAHAG